MVLGEFSGAFAEPKNLFPRSAFFWMELGLVSTTHFQTMGTWPKMFF